MSLHRGSTQRSLTVLWTTISCAVACLGAAGLAHAYPIPPPPPCTFTLSAPVVDSDVVTATVQSAGCAPMAAPYASVACLQPGDGATADCVQARGANPARVSVAYRPGTAYVATGRGCAGWVGFPPAPDCQLLGPNR